MLDLLRGNVDTRTAICAEEFEAANPGVEHFWRLPKRSPGSGGDRRRKPGTGSACSA